MLSILGGSASSRLYRRLRDESGLCYDLECFDMTWADTGLVGVATALAPENERAAIAAICSELRRFLDEGPGEAELERARAQAESGIVLSLESTLARMRRMGQNELFLRRERGVEELLERCAAVTRGEVLELARRVLRLFRRLSCRRPRRPARDAGGVRRACAACRPGGSAQGRAGWELRWACRARLSGCVRSVKRHTARVTFPLRRQRVQA